MCDVYVQRNTVDQSTSDYSLLTRHKSRSTRITTPLPVRSPPTLTQPVTKTKNPRFTILHDLPLTPTSIEPPHPPTHHRALASSVRPLHLPPAAMSLTGNEAFDLDGSTETEEPTSVEPSPSSPGQILGLPAAGSAAGFDRRPSPRCVGVESGNPVGLGRARFRFPLSNPT